MYLKSIEVQGFKSFANKILFEFHDGITGIVGPNGSGKSNVADAVRWVLGEQSAKQLRGGNMQDVIFSGTENRSPQSYAKVTINMDNSDHTLDIDFDEVAVTRKLYRSGESEYLLNNSPCRLKDIQELFYDTGIGKEGYSIIGQGQIDKILSGKPEERRELFDEAVGIVKFKRRKNQTQKKLDNERSNITRVNDILEELERQVGPLAKQSEKAKNYLAFKEELKTYDINMFLIEVDRINNDLSTMNTNLDNVSRELEETKTTLEQSKEDYDKVENEIQDLTNQIDELRKQQSEAAILKEQIEGSIKVLEEQLHSQDAIEAHFDDRKNELNQQIEKRVKEKQRLEYENKDLKVALDKAMAEKEQSESEIAKIKESIEETNTKIESKQNWIIEELNRRAMISGNSERFDVLMDQNKKQKSEITRKLIEIKSSEDTVKQEAETRAIELSEITDNLNEMSTALEGQKKDAKEYEELLKKIETDFAKSQSDYHMLNSKYESLKNLTERYEGYGNSIRKIMENKSSNRGIKGVVADIIKVPQKYETAIEIALGASIQNIVVDDETTAKNMIRFLKDNKFGRATFLPLSALHDDTEFKFQDALNSKGVIGLASDVVDVDKEYADVAKTLLGRIIVVDNIDNAIALSKEYKNKFQIVTIDGENLKPGGSMTGGRYKNASNLLSKNRELEELSASVDKAKKEMEELVSKREKVESSKAQAESLVMQLSGKVHQLEISKHEVQLKLEDSRLKLNELNQELESLKNENALLDEQVEEVKQDKMGALDDLANSEKEEQEANKLISVLEKELAVLKSKEEELESSQEEVLLSSSRLEQKYAFVEESFNNLENEIKEYESQMQSLIDSNNNSDEIKESKRLEIEKLKASIVDGEELFNNIASQIDTKEKEKEELTSKHKESLDKREELTNRNSDLDKEKYRLTTKLESLEESRDKYVNYMWEEYELTFDSSKTLRDENLNDVSFLRRRINELKRDIRNLGDVNVNAIEDYKNVGERYEFMKTQRDDLIKAEATLLDIIAELDEGMTKQFNEQFEKINTEYNKVFRSLFGGGKGYIELIDPKDVLETGVKIIAQPPGKKLQNMMQLSGGEKALTAIALLFAIQNLKPSPFCLLDEIEAALDDSNVDKFADYLHAMTKNTQFIVITHRRGTMTSADRLYGITMQEKGVSALVSVDLVEEELDD